MWIDFDKKLKEVAQKSIANNCDVIYTQSDIQKIFPNFEILRPEQFYVAWSKDGCTLQFYFFEWNYEGDKDIGCTLLWHGSGPTDNLRECRHSYIGDEGYVFYINRKNFEAAFDWLEKYYDLG